ncbi:MAG: exopolysaccharide biosynthesis polyprenyl glycosylphosphotransferase [Eubacteriales bacterium]|nr:exopolysaccharide biosynthesis polyprenyl glycosylphosphotransferase [Eubacteriales bacterium]
MRGLKLLHLAISNLLLIACWWLYYEDQYEVWMNSKSKAMLFVFYGFMLFLFFRIYEAYDIGYHRITDNVYSQSLSQGIAASILWIVSIVVFDRLTNPLPFVALCGVQLIWNVAWCFIANRMYSALYRNRKTVVIYRDDDDLRRLKEIGRLSHRFNIQKYIKNPPDDYKVLEVQIKGFDAIVVSGVDASLRNGIAKYCIETGISGYFAPHVGDIIMQGARHIRSFSVPIMSVKRATPTPEYLFIKRSFDIVLSALAMVVLSPLFLVTALAIKLYDHGPVLYRQVRLTRNGRRFEMLKFRSMCTDAEKDGVARLSTGENDDRITPVGRVIRACRLDELPQLVNILKGDMSIVGPRPERPEIAARYEADMPAFSLRLQVKAGLTGYAQVYGKYNTDPYDKLEMDLMYVNKMGIFEDLRLMFATVRILFLRDSTEGVGAGSVTARDRDTAA